MVIKQFAPSAALAPYVRAYEIIETRDAVTRTLLPDTCIIIGFRYAGSSTLLNDDAKSDGAKGDAAKSDGASRAPRPPLPNICVTGLRTSVREMHTAANSGIILAKFRAAGAAPFFTEPLHHLFGSMCPLTGINGNVGGDNVSDGDGDAADARIRAIVNASTDDDRVARVEDFLLTRYRPMEPTAVVGDALRAISATAGAIRVRTLANDLGISQDALEKHFRRIVGATPKQFATIVRLRQAVELSRQSPSLTALALDAGYYDQSHFIRDFRAITGDAPGHFFQHARFC